MQDTCGDGGSAKQRRGDLRPLAPRDSRPSSGRARASAAGSSSSTGRPPRLSHRSRAGCWTCRGRKVKCDETHPRCGPCTRLNRECDWDHRWNFNDSTTSTQVKYANVNTSGNAVWDPTLRHHYSTSPSVADHDLLADFASLTTDEDRERKAGTYRPGTFGVVATPESFHDLPEYAAFPQSQFGSRRTSTASTGSFGRGHKSLGPPTLSRCNTQPDPNIIVLERFEDSSPVLSPTASVHEIEQSRPYGQDLQRLRIPTSSYPSNVGDAKPLTPLRGPDDSLLAHFRQYIVPRLAQPQQSSGSGVISQGSSRDILDLEATRFRPLHHAICAVSALNLAYNGRSSLEDALQHYHQALAASATAASPNELISDAVFFRHYLLLIYDVCIPMQSEDDGTNMWGLHLNNLLRIAMQRVENHGRETFAYTLWTICELDMYACLMGNGSCEFVRTIGERNLLPALDHQVPCTTAIQEPLTGALLPHEAHIFPPILRLKQGIVLLGAKVARTAQGFRSEATYSPGTTARWHATATALQNEVVTFWQQNYPPHLGPESPQVAISLPDRIRTVFEHALALYHAIIIYARTSMFPGQRCIPFAAQTDSINDIEIRISDILHIAETQIESAAFEKRHIVFPLFMAGYATFNERVKGRVLEVMDCFVGSGIGQNTWRCRQLLGALVEEQRRAAVEGKRMESVEWLVVGRERGLGVVNCGL